MPKLEAMRTVSQHFQDDARAGLPCSYYGERGGWFIVLGQTRDSDTLERSNFRSALHKLGGESDTVAVERFNHWACGWVESILVAPGASDKIEVAEEIREALNDYPVVCEEDFSELEFDEYQEALAGQLDVNDPKIAALIEELEGLGRYSMDGDGAWEIIEQVKGALAEEEREEERKQELRDLGLPEEWITGRPPAKDCKGQLKLELGGMTR